MKFPSNPKSTSVTAGCILTMMAWEIWRESYNYKVMYLTIQGRNNRVKSAKNNQDHILVVEGVMARFFGTEKVNDLVHSSEFMLAWKILSNSSPYLGILNGLVDQQLHKSVEDLALGYYLSNTISTTTTSESIDLSSLGLAGQHWFSNNGIFNFVDLIPDRWANAIERNSSSRSQSLQVKGRMCHGL